ncbi:leucine-rich repeat domain-containing protein [Microscilla marina]|nr:leucine-rich repeat domain-containing protein [Microscilla marina]
MINRYNSFLEKKSDQLWASYTGDSFEFWRAYEKLVARSKKNVVPTTFVKKQMAKLVQQREYAREGVWIMVLILITSSIFFLGTRLSESDITKNNALPVLQQKNYPPQTKVLDLSDEPHRIMPAQITKLPALITLKLSRNGMFNLSPEIGQLKQLQVFEVTDNFLTTLPQSIGQLKKLKYLNLSKNSLTHLPETIARLESLEVLILSHNEITTIPYEIKSLKKLKILDISHNKITRLPETINALDNLETLIISHNQLTELPLYLDRLKKLKVLKFAHNKFIVLPATIGTLKKTVGVYQ